ncbi:MAG TPA: CRISPR-associated endonuclease Cas1 [Patescibacteria group bacterium]|nr:CRISPR-associated endonuclease Cas1 [Patescibacteria group bacterium]
MAATQTLPQVPQVGNFEVPSSTPPELGISKSQTVEVLTPRRGVVTLFGYGIRVRVDRGHLILEDGIGAARRAGRFSRVRHGLKRVVAIGSDGMVSLAALRWLADQDAAFAMLDRNGSVLAVTGPVRPSDARLRRAQALAVQSGTGLRIARQLVNQKVAAQERLASDGLQAPAVAQTIREARSALASAATIDSLRAQEAQAAHAYWSAWRNIPLTFPKQDARRVPDHWLTFGTRISPLSGSPRLAANPANAILNYLYAILETEARLAVAALGLDPGLGVMHLDSRTRDSLACDLMEPIRPQVDAYLLEWITREAFRREWFFEERNGNCRLMASLATQLAETGPTWAMAVAPLAEWVSHTLWRSISKSVRRNSPATRLTQSHKRGAKGATLMPPAKPLPRPPAVCRDCGAPIKPGRNYCAFCGVVFSRAGLIEAAKLGRAAGHSPEARARQAKKQRRNAAALKRWNPTEQPEWLTENFYREEIQPHLAGVTVPAIASALGLSQPYAARIRAGKQCPHPRHWQALARLAGASRDRKTHLQWSASRIGSL